MNLPQVLLIHYHEISLKGENKPFFERMLLHNIKRALPSSSYEKAHIVFGRIVVWLREGGDEEAVRRQMRRVLGIANFAFGWEVAYEFNALSPQIAELVSQREFKTFRVSARRADKQFPLTSQEINEKLGLLIEKQFKKRVDLEHPDLTCFVEIVGKYVFVYFEKKKGYGGLPVGVSGKVLALLSSGFDSPVASWRMMRRGCNVAFVHFHSYPSTSAASQENVKELVKILTTYQYHSKLFMVPFLPIQQEIVSAKIDPSQRVILYRRFMARIAEHIAKNEKCGALVTGESLGQVASQTLENIAVISGAVRIPILRPLIGENKESIIANAREIGTHDISAQPYEDCCSLFVPEHPETKAKLSVIERMEEKLDAEAFIKEAIERAELVEFSL